MLFSAVSSTVTSVCYPACYILIVIAPPMVWVGAVVGWSLVDVLAGASVRIAIASCIGLKPFIAFTQDTALSWDAD